MFLDKTGKNGSESDLSKGPERILAFIDNLPGMAYRCMNAPEWPMEFVSRGCLELTGYTPEELTSGALNYADLIHRDDRRAVEEAVKEGTDRGGFFRMEYRIRRKNGEELHVWEQGRQVEKGVLEGFITDITARRQAEAGLKKLEWMLSSSGGGMTGLPSEYGDLTALNTCRTILDSVGEETLKDICADYMDLLGTSTAVYEVNGDYALSIFASGWCSFLDDASRRLCETEDNSRALASEKWLCHRSCWDDCAEAAIRKGGPVEISCNGGIRLYGVPIFAGEDVAGAITVGLGDPPTDPDELSALAERYGVDPGELRSLALGYEARPPYILESARRRLRSSARLIGEIVERNRARKELQEARQLLQDVLDTIPVRVFWKDLDLNYLGCNMPFAKDSGVGSPHRIRGMNDFQMGWREQAEMYRKDDLQVIRSGTAKTGYEEPQTTPDGRRIWLRTSKIPLRAPDRSIIGVLGTYEEITGSKMAEESLRESESKLKAIFASAPMGIGIVRDRVIREANQAFCQMLKRSHDEIVGKSAMIIYPSRKEYDRVGQEKAEQIRSRGTCSLEVNMLRSDGEPLSVLIGVTPLYPHDPSLGEVFTAVDITDRKKAGERIRLQAMVLDQISDRVTITDLEGRITFVNQKEVESMGYTREELVGNTVHIYGGDPEGDAVQDRIIRNTLENGSWRGVVVNRTKAGEEVIMDSRVQLIRNAAGEPVCLCGISTDITDRVRQEKEKEAMQARLLHAQKLESIGRLAGGVAHDFNNMLGVILGHADILERSVEPGSPVLDNLKEIRAAAERSATLTGQLLGFARRQPAAPRVLDLNATLSGMLEMLRRLIGENIRLEWVPGRDPGNVIIDPDQLNQVLANLVVNARDAIAGEGRLHIRTDNIVFDPSISGIDPEIPPGRYVMLEVSDTGCGIERENLEHLFEPFFTTKEVGRGTGLGLATVFGIVSQNRGVIRVYTEPGSGSTFRIYLPRADQPASPPEPEEHPAERKGHETILIVEDERMILNTAAEALSGGGYRVLRASKPGYALKVLERHSAPIHLLVTDLVMPEMNGRELSERVSNLRPGVKTLFISGYTEDVIARQGMLEEGINFLQKPFSIRMLLEAVGAILGGSR